MKPWLAEYQVLLSKQISQDKLPHALLITGVESAGKLELAQWLVQVLHCQSRGYDQSTQLLNACGLCKTCLLYQSQTYPDHMSVTALKKTIGVDEVRQTSRFLEKTAHIGTNKSVLIPLAETMTNAAANALLKTLEEPTENSFIVLLSTDEDRLLPTIVSRCRLLSIRAYVGNKLLSDMAEHYTDDTLFEHAEKFVNLTHLPELKEINGHKKFLQFQECFFLYLINQQDQTAILNLLVDEPESIRWLEKIIVNLTRSQYDWLTFIKANENLKQNSEQNFEQLLNPDKLCQIFKIIMQNNKHAQIYSQFNHQFAMEKLLIEIGELASN